MQKPTPTLQILPLCLLCFFAAIAPLSAQTSFPMLGGAFPLGVQRGKTTDVTVYAGGNGGANLYGAYKALFAGQGVSAIIVPPEKGWPEKPKADPKDPKKEWGLPVVGEIKMRVTVAPDAPLGPREFRVATPRMGSSTIAQLVVSDAAQVLEAEPNNDVEHAQPVTLPCDINGRIGQGEDVDCYKFSATPGQEVTFVVQCARLLDKIHDLQEHADPVLILRDLNGLELARNDDYYRADSLLHYKFDKAGQYVIQIRDVNYQGNPFWMYRLTLTTSPYVTGVVPCAVAPGASVDLRVSGFNLKGAATGTTNGTGTAHVDVPANTPPGLWTTTLKMLNGTTNAIPLLVTTAPQTVITNTGGGNASGNNASANNASGNNTASRSDGRAQTAALSATPTPALTRPASFSAPRPAPNPLHLPGGVNAVLTAPGEIDRYIFHAQKGAAWGFEVTSRRLDSEMDSELKLRDAKGNVIAANDDALGKDSRIEWTCPTDGDYTLELRDLTGHAGPTYFYNLTAQPLRPDFVLQCDGDRAQIAAGNRTAWFVKIERKYGFAGEVKVDVQGLPPGVTASALTVPPQMTQGVVVLSAAPDAKIDMGSARVVGTAQVPIADGKTPQTQTRTAHVLSEIYMPGGGRGLLDVDTQGVAVTEANDLEVTVANPNITIKPGETVKIDVTIKRRPDYTKAVTLDLRVNHLGGIFTDPLPPGVTVEDGAAIPEGKTVGTITLKAAPNAAPIANWPLAVMANVSINFVMKVWYAAPLSLTVAVPPPPAPVKK